MKAETLDKKFDYGKSVLKHFDRSKTTRPGLEQKRVNLDFPVWMIQRLDKEAKRLGVPRQSTYALLLISLSEIKFQTVKLLSREIAQRASSFHLGPEGDSEAYFTGPTNPSRPPRLERSGR